MEQMRLSRQSRPQLISPKMAARLLCVTNRTLQRWADKGLVKAHRNPSGHRRYYLSSILAIAPEPELHIQSKPNPENKPESHYGLIRKGLHRVGLI